MTTLKENGTCCFTSKEGDIVKVQTTRELVAKVLFIIEGNNNFVNLKLTDKENLAIFSTLTPSEQNYETYLVLDEVKMAIQFYNQYFLLLKPQRYNHPNIHGSYFFMKVYQTQKPLLGNLREKIFKDVTRSILMDNYHKMHYVG